MGHKITGTLSKLSRKVRRNREHAMKARGKHENEMQQVAFARGFQLGADMFKARILNATAGIEYPEEAPHDEEPGEMAPAGQRVYGDPMFESALGSDVYIHEPPPTTGNTYFGPISKST